jgi:polyisoprenoid-binding protein YceI
MTNRHISLSALGCTIAIGLCAVTPTAATCQEASPSPLRLVSNRVSLAGTSNIHPYTASSSEARIVRLQLASGVLGGHGWEQILKPGALEAFEISIPAATLSSPKEGLDKNMHKALKVTEYPDITFRLSRFEGAGASGALRGVGILKIAGVEREVAVALKTQGTDTNFTVTGEVQLLMTDFGITPPKAMLGMLKTDPKVTVTFETVFGIPLT